MSLNEVTSKIDEEIKSGEFMLQAVFNRNIQAIEMLKQEGYSYKTIYKRLMSDLNERHFRSLIFNARKSIHPKNEPVIESPNKNIVHTQEPNKTLEEWIDILGFEITERTLNKIVTLKLTKDEVLRVEVLNQRRLINYLNELTHKRKNK